MFPQKLVDIQKSLPEEVVVSKTITMSKRATQKDLDLVRANVFSVVLVE